MTFSTQALSAFFGLLLGLVNFIGFRSMAAKLRESGALSNRARVMMFVAWFDLFAFPVVGYFIPTIFAGL